MTPKDVYDRITHHDEDDDLDNNDSDGNNGFNPDEHLNNTQTPQEEIRNPEDEVAPFGPGTVTSARDPEVVGRVEQLIRDFGGDPDELSGRLVRDMMQTALRLVQDNAHTGELKLISRSLGELRYALKVFRPYGDVRKVSIFGSARTPATHPDYLQAVTFAREIAKAGWMVITGAGDGIMRAGHEGAGAEASFGVSIMLPFETSANDIIEGDPKHTTFRYFFTRKLMFVSQADALILFPGGFGTLDECFETLTLVQTGKSSMIPIAMVEPEGNGYWEHFDRYVREHLLKNNLISEPDLNLYQIFHDPQQAVDYVKQFYRNYHSQRFVRDKLVIRLLEPLSERALDQLNDEFADLIVEGRITQSGAHETEVEHLHLPRISFRFTRRDFGRFRQMIDRINELSD
ncbi:MAG: TIGR00730 family Rossman fold protein [Phycisphaeraceae bacterium]